MAVLNLIANRRKKLLCQLLSHDEHTSIRINAFLTGTTPEVVEQARELLSKGFKEFKLKVGVGSIDDDIARVQTVSAVLEGKALLHIDANRSWTFDQAVDFIEEIGLCTVDYVEEPFADIRRIPEFFEQTSMPVALDESLPKLNFEDIKSIEGVDMIIIKPTVIGSIERIWQIITEAKRFAIQSIISSSYESSVGILTLANITGTEQRHVSAGLDTLKWFQKNLLRDPIVIDRGQMNIAHRQLTSKDINFDMLTEIQK